jgi:hypothetical protein
MSAFKLNAGGAGTRIAAMSPVVSKHGAGAMPQGQGRKLAAMGNEADDWNEY